MERSELVSTGILKGFYKMAEICQDAVSTVHLTRLAARLEPKVSSRISTQERGKTEGRSTAAYSDQFGRDSRTNKVQISP